MQRDARSGFFLFFFLFERLFLKLAQFTPAASLGQTFS